jgi:prepilin-type N-terminal cleavage/methylation domain-containing protein
MKGQSGMTLVELMVSLAIVLLITVAVTAGYIKILTSYKSQSAMSANFMSNLTGFDLMRYDIQMAGYGLPTNVPGFTYTEAAAKSAYSGYIPPYDPSSLNELTIGNPNGAPHPFVLGAGTTPNNTLSGNTSAVLAIKSSVANICSASGHFGVVSTALDTSTLATGDHYIVIDSSGTLQQGSASGSWDNTFNPHSPPGPLSTGLVGFLFGLGPSPTNAMPFNRVDYYLDRSYNMPSYCAPNTFELYRGTISQTNGQLVSPPTPLIDCVEDIQVAFGVDTSGGTSALVWQTVLPADQRDNLKEVKVFIIYQEGRGNVSKTPGFGFSGSLSPGDGDPQTQNIFPSSVHAFTPGPQYTQFRWRLKEIDVKPMNLHGNW